MVFFHRQTSKSVKTPEVSDFNDSLSSLSIESEDDGNLLSQTISAGANKQSKNQEGSSSNPINIPLKPRLSTEMCNESISSVDSCGKDDATNSILEQCIQSGINKVIKKDSSSKSRERILVTSSPKKSMLPTYNKPSGSKSLKNESKALDIKDEELLQECINTGIRKNTRQEQPLVEKLAKLSVKEPKNSETTSVIALDIHPQCVSTITGVEVKTEENSTKKSPPILNSFKNSKIETPDQDANIALKSERSRQENWAMQNGCSTSTSFEYSLDDNILERSNEYPAAKLSIGVYADLDDDSMNISNEFMMENEKLAAKVENKHKDPDLMMKSVDRLTHELVSTAEYLRQNAAHTVSDEISKMSGSNTWNDENSFPSISLSAPMIGSTNEEITIATDQFYPIQEEKSFDKDKNDLEDKTPTNENYTFDAAPEAHGPEEPFIAFKVGGEIGANSLKKFNFLSNGPTSIETCSTMSNSTIVQVEAKRIANKLTSMTNKLMDSTSSLDLENVRPPSSMDCVSLSSFQESSIPIQQSPFKKKSLVTGLVAKRALGHQILSASAENVNSIQHIESIRPPSIMDELLDSMISVDSIVSEIVEATTIGVSNYETALSDMEDSLTLRSCQDLSKDECTSSDFSSVESTPKRKNSRSIKMKRQSEKDRYRTYTIQVDMLLKEQQQQKQDIAEQTRKSLNARQRRQDDRQRFETQVISHSPTNRKFNPENIKTCNIELDDDSSIRAMTDKFEFIRNIPLSDCNIDREGIKDKLDRIRSAGSLPVKQTKTDDSLEYERQNSETESQRDMNNSLNFDPNSSGEHLTPVVATSAAVVIPKPIRPGKNSYISPYRMTRVTPMKNKSLKVTKSPVIAKVATRNSSFDVKTSAKEKQKKQAVAKELVKATSTSATLPIRQGTFIQDEPTLDNVPVVNDLPPSPEKTAPSSKLKPPAKISKIPTTPSSTSQLKYRSNSNASMKIPIMTPVRSNTGISLNPPKKSVSSKIAGIWKSENKKESFLKKPGVTTSSITTNAANKLAALPNPSLKKSSQQRLY